jgi:Ca2+-binding EF-hand superfamily protein
MPQQFQKGKTDSINLEEFSEMFRKRSLDLYFPRDEQRLMFEQFDDNHSSSIDVGAVISRYEHAAPTIVATGRINEQQRKERNEKVISKIYKERENHKLLVSPRQTTLQIVRSLRNLDPNSTGYISKEELRWGLGKDYMNIPLTAEEIDTVVELCPPDKHNGKINYEKFAKLLDIKNNDPVIEPFFDARANQVTRMKNRIESFEKSIHDETTLARRDYLMKACHGEAAGPVTNVNQGGFDVYQNGGLSTLNKVVSCPELVLSQSPVRSRVHCQESSGGDESIKSHTPSHSHFLTSMKLRGKGGTQHQNSMDLSDEVHSSEPSGLMPGGKRLFNYKTFDETLLQHSMGTHNSMSHSQSYDAKGVPGSPSFNNYLSQSMSDADVEEDRFKTTGSEYFAPLLYRPSVPVTRPNVLGDSMKCAMEREARRKKRFQRTAKNLQSFADHKELDDLSTVLNDNLRCKGRALEALHYESAAMHSDMKKFVKQQVVTMQRKPNKDLYDKMWGGDKEQSRKPVDRAEDRDFNTTYNGSFVLQHED